MHWTLELAGGSIPVIADDENDETVLILAHGAGGHMEQKNVEWLACLARSCGLRVVRFNFLYRTQGKPIPDRMPVLMDTYKAVMASVRERLKPAKLIIGGHSMGGRVASMLASEGPVADGLLLFSYPLHPPGKQNKPRDAHLYFIRIPVLQFSGTEDEFCERRLMETVHGRLNPRLYTLHWIEGAGHSYSLSKASGRKRPEMEEEIVGAMEEWVGRVRGKG